MNNGSYYDKGEFKIINVGRENQTGFNDISATKIRNMIKNNDEKWKLYIPKENHELVEIYFKEFNNKNINGHND